MADWLIEPRDSTGYRSSDPISRWSSLEVVERYVKPGGWKVTGPETSLAPLMVRGSGVVLSRDGTQIMSGQMTSFTRNGDGGATVVGWDDNIWLGGGPQDDRGLIILPNYALPVAAQTAQAVTFSGPREDIITNLIYSNIGPIALVPRRVPRLRMSTSLHRGGTVARTIKLELLHHLVEELAEAGGLDVNIVHIEDGTGPRLDVQITAVVDVSADVRFGPADQGGPGVLGTDWSYTVSAPTMTAAVVAGTVPPPQVFGDDPDPGTPGVDLRQYREVTASPGDWARRIEGLVDASNTNTAAELDQAGTDALTEAAERREFSGTIVDSPDVRYGREWRTGYRVGVTVAGDEFSDVVREVVTTVAVADGQQTESLSAAIGWSQASALTTPSQRAQQSTMRRAAKISAWG